jgi:hypothetical protein
MQHPLCLEKNNQHATVQDENIEDPEALYQGCNCYACVAWISVLSAGV